MARPLTVFGVVIVRFAVVDPEFTIRNKPWVESLQESFKDKKIKEIERSPNKWQSEQ